MRVEIAVNPQIGGKRHGSTLDERIAALAERQHGVVSRVQLIALGASRRAIERRIERGLLHPVHRGVYAVGHRALSREGRWMAAVLAMGRGAVLSYRSAAALWGLRQTARAAVEITVPRPMRPRAGLDLHRSVLPRDETTTSRDIPVTSPPRTLLDLAAVLPPHQLERALNEAEHLRLTDPLSLTDLLTRHPRRRGVATLRQLLDTPRNLTRSELEDRFLAFLDAHDLPRPHTNTLIDDIEADCVWPTHHLIVELDGFATHATRAAFERDRARDRRLQAAGWRVVRITWRQLHDEPRALAAALGTMLAR